MGAMLTSRPRPVLNTLCGTLGGTVTLDLVAGSGGKVILRTFAMPYSRTRGIERSGVSLSRQHADTKPLPLLFLRK